MPFLLLHLGYMKKEETQMTYGVIEATVRFSITAEGDRVLSQWF